jgi:undecaprenyl-diphosphatase
MKLLLIAIWPVGLAVIFGSAAWLSHRAALAGEPLLAPTGPGTSGRVPGGHSRTARSSSWATDIVRFLAVAVAGMIVVWGLMTLLGLVVVPNGHLIDKPLYDSIIGHQAHFWVKIMDRATKFGNIWTTWGASLAAGGCLAVTWSRRRWLPLIALATLIVGDHFVVHSIHHFIHRVGPPNSPLGAFPSGGAERCVVFYGLIAYLIWREFIRTRRGGWWAAAAVAALAFNEGYSRTYLTLHWLTDVLSGWIYGALLLAALMVAIRVVAGPVRACSPLAPARSPEPARPAPSEPSR